MKVVIQFWPCLECLFFKAHLEFYKKKNFFTQFSVLQSHFAIILCFLPYFTAALLIVLYQSNTNVSSVMPAPHLPRLQTCQLSTSSSPAVAESSPGYKGWAGSVNTWLIACLQPCAAPLRPLEALREFHCSNRSAAVRSELAGLPVPGCANAAVCSVYTAVLQYHLSWYCCYQHFDRDTAAVERDDALKNDCSHQLQGKASTSSYSAQACKPGKLI